MLLGFSITLDAKASEPSVYQNLSESQARSVLQNALDQMDPVLFKTLQEQVRLAKKEYVSSLDASQNIEATSVRHNIIDVICYYTSIAAIGKAVGGFCMDIHANQKGERKIYFLNGYGVGASLGLKGSVVLGFFHNPQTSDPTGEYESVSFTNFRHTAHAIAHLFGHVTKVRSIFGLDFIMSYQTYSYATHSQTDGLMVLLGAGLGIIIDLSSMSMTIR